MNIEDRDARRRCRTVDNRLPLTGGREGGDWRLEIGPGSRSNGCRACKHPSNDWPNRNLHNTWRSATRLSLRSPRRELPSVSVKPPNFLGLGSDQEFPVVIELSVSSVQDFTCWLAKLCKAACRTPRSSLSALLPIDRRWHALTRLREFASQTIIRPIMYNWDHRDLYGNIAFTLFVVL